MFVIAANDYIKGVYAHTILALTVSI